MVDIISLQPEAWSAKYKLAHGVVVFTGLCAFRGKLRMTPHVMAPQVNSCVVANIWTWNFTSATCICTWIRPMHAR
jgi:hypothetical protein